MGVLRIKAVDRNRAIKPASKFGPGAVLEQRTASRGNTENAKGRLTHLKAPSAARTAKRRGIWKWYTRGAVVSMCTRQR